MKNVIQIKAQAYKKDAFFMFFLLINFIPELSLIFLHVL